MFAPWQMNPWEDEVHGETELRSKQLMNDIARSVAFFDVIRDIRTMSSIGRDTFAGPDAPTPTQPTFLERVLGRRRPQRTAPRPIVAPSTSDQERGLQFEGDFMVFGPGNASD